MGIYLRPHKLDQALDALSAQRLAILAGGTDYYPSRVGRPLNDDILDVTAIAGLDTIEDRGDHWFIGARASWTDLIRADLPAAFDGLKLAAREIGGVQVQNAGTLVGNLCNASPAADGTPNLLALDARVVLASAGGRRSVPVREFVTGNRATMRKPDELVLGITVPKPAAGTAATFVKLGARKYLVISIVMAAFVIEPDGGKVGRARVAVGSCAPVATRLDALEVVLVGRPLNGSLGEVVAEDHLHDVLAPIDDVRGSAEYRLDAALTVVRRGLCALGASMGKIS